MTELSFAEEWGDVEDILKNKNHMDASLDLFARKQHMMQQEAASISFWMVGG